ncbi:MAG: hypothetical protein Kow0092_22800 [Deferrisomatales bacterium]
MWERIQDTVGGIDWQGLLEHVSNDRLVALFTHPYGLAALGVLVLLCVVLKWRILFVAVTGALLVGLVTKYTLAGHQMGPSRHLFLFAGGAVAVGAFIIYFLFIREE